MTDWRVFALAIGVALIAAAGWAQTMTSDGLTIKNGNLPQIALSPETKLAKAYALCRKQDLERSVQVNGHWRLVDIDPDCTKIEDAWAQHKPSDADRTFIEDVARSLK